MKRTNVLLIFGGQSSEHDVSLMSAANVYAALDAEKYAVSLIKITRDGEWQFAHSVTESDTGVAVTIDSSNRRFVLHDGTAIIPDVVWPVLHGKLGEDGTIQGLLEMMNVPYVGCDVEASALCMDKMRTKLLLEHSSKSAIKTAPWISLSVYEDWQRTSRDITTVDQSVGYSDLTERIGDGPWFVKPSRSGSSVGVSKVIDAASLEAAIEQAFQHDDTVLIEQGISGHEIEIALLGDGGNLVVSSPGEIIPGDEFYSYEDKYASGSSSQMRLELPDSVAPLEKAIKEKAAKIYKILGCSGLARIDFFVTDEMEVYFNEVNTMPGFTNISMYPKLMEQAGYSQPQLVDRLIQHALE